MKVVALAGGVGGAKLAHGFKLALDSPEDLTVIGNTADDFDLYGLRICPDIDTVLYTLAGLANPVTGWGIAGDTFATLEMVGRYAGQPWFQLGDRDFATHIVRTERLRQGASLSSVTADLASALGIGAAIVPMSDDAVATMIDTPDGRLDFQQYFVGRRHVDEVVGVHFAGIGAARPAPGALSVLDDADAIVFCPSNPIVSIGPILAVPGMREALAQATAPKVAVSPIVGGEALKGPAAQMLAGLGHEVSAAGVAAIYAGLLDGMIIDLLDESLAPRIEALGMRVHVTQTVMRSDDDRADMAREVLAFVSAITADA
ncbi:MAG TPA: 2-phospho-L-lactate transferase [Thermomicrobiales bacterium]|nr:2-phospho-L-lactate transferase [Thermomicrobiales bacterium]